jgi:hypothetical protein
MMEYRHSLQEAQKTRGHAMGKDNGARLLVLHSHERRLPGSMIDDEFEVYFELILSHAYCKTPLVEE